MVKVVKSTVLEAPVERVWEVLRDFNGHDSWHPAVRDSAIEQGQSSDRIGCVRRFHSAGRRGAAASGCSRCRTPDMAFSYCLLDTPVPLLNYVAHVAPRAGHRRGRHVLALGEPVRHAGGPRSGAAHDGRREHLSGRVRCDPHPHGAGRAMTSVETYPTLAEAARAMGCPARSLSRAAENGGDARGQRGHGGPVRIVRTVRTRACARFRVRGRNGDRWRGP